MASRVERPSLGNTATAESDPALHFLSARSAASLSATLRSWQLRFSHDPGVGERHDDMKVAIHDAFRAAHRQLEDMLRKQHGRVKTHEVAPHGVIKSLFQDHGFIAAPNELPLNRDLAPNLDHLIDRQPEEIGHLVRVSFHRGEKAFLPFWQRVTVYARNYRFAADIIGHVIQKNVAALLLCLAQDGWNIGPLHEAKVSRCPPKVRGLQDDKQAVLFAYPRDRLDGHVYDHDTFVKRAAMFDVRGHDRWHPPLCTG